LTETWFRYFLLNPLFRILTKSPASALQSTLHALFLPTPFKYLAHSPDDTRKRAPEEVLKPGALYAECAVVPVRVPVTPVPPAKDKSKGGGKDRDAQTGDEMQPDDGELGGVALGMQVWDDYERQLKMWDAAEADLADAGKEEHQPGGTS
jgi:hypothetical protein